MQDKGVKQLALTFGLQENETLDLIALSSKGFTNNNETVRNKGLFIIAKILYTAQQSTKPDIPYYMSMIDKYTKEIATIVITVSKQSAPVAEFSLQVISDMVRSGEKETLYEFNSNTLNNIVKVSRLFDKFKV